MVRDKGERRTVGTSLIATMHGPILQVLLEYRAYTSNIPQTASNYSGSYKYMYIYIYLCVNVHVYMYICIYVYMYTYEHLSKLACRRVYKDGT